MARERLKLASTRQRLRSCVLYFLKHKNQQVRGLEGLLPVNTRRGLVANRHRLDRAALRLSLLDPTLVLQRGYAWLADTDGHTVTSAAQVHPGQPVRATLADGTVDMTVSPPR